MTNGKPQSRTGSGRHGLHLLGVVLGVAITLSYTWKKVEFANAAQGLARARSQAGSILEERKQLVAAIADKKRPGTIKLIAQDRLGMSYPNSRVVDFVRIQ